MKLLTRLMIVNNLDHRVSSGDWCANGTIHLGLCISLVVEKVASHHMKYVVLGHYTCSRPYVKGPSRLVSFLLSSLIRYVYWVGQGREINCIRLVMLDCLAAQTGQDPRVC